MAENASEARNVPVIDSAIICIVDRENASLAAIVSSYFSVAGIYVPIFTFPGIKNAKAGTFADPVDDDFVPQMVGQEAATKIANMIAQLGGCKTLILAGLSAAQRSYINSNDARVIEVAQQDDVDGAFREIGINRQDTLRCRPDEMLLGLSLAKRRNCRLWIADDAELLPPDATSGCGLIIVEQDQANAACVVAVNYAHAVGATLRTVRPLLKRAESGVARLLQRWREENSPEAWDDLRTMMLQRIGDIDFHAFPYVTFFTDGLPYSLIVAGAIPCTYVHLGLFPDRLIVGAIIRERTRRRLASAVIFAIEDFRHKDETNWLLGFLEYHNYAVEPILGTHATVESFGYYCGYFPYDLLHISTHGGEVEGSFVRLKFTARDGREHVVEYDEVVGVARTSDGSGLVNVQHKALLRKLDNLDWGSEALHGPHLPESTYVDATNAIFQGIGVVSRDREPRNHITGSCVVVCSDGFHQAMFRTLAAHGHPIIFNNTCSSWLETAHFFLSSGGVAYIGTLWDVPLYLATDVAEVFYTNARTGSIMEALYEANRSIADTVHRDIYVLWGLHFSTLSLGASLEASLEDVRHRMVRQIRMYLRLLEKPLPTDAVNDAVRVLRWAVGRFRDRFPGPEADRIVVEVGAVLAARRGRASNEEADP